MLRPEALAEIYRNVYAAEIRRLDQATNTIIAHVGTMDLIQRNKVSKFFMERMLHKPDSYYRYDSREFEDKHGVNVHHNIIAAELRERTSFPLDEIPACIIHQFYAENTLVETRINLATPYKNNQWKALRTIILPGSEPLAAQVNTYQYGNGFRPYFEARHIDNFWLPNVPHVLDRLARFVSGS